MLTRSTTEKDSTFGLIPPLQSTMPWHIVGVEVVADWTLKVRFIDGLSGLIRFEQTRFRGVFEVLKNPDLFKQVYVEHGAVTWPGELDLAPDAMYDEIKAHGEWILK